jgi:hypothetical protein
MNDPHFVPGERKESESASPSFPSTTPLALVFTDMVGSSLAKRAEALGPDWKAYRPSISTWFAPPWPSTRARK